MRYKTTEETLCNNPDAATHLLQSHSSCCQEAGRYSYILSASFCASNSPESVLDFCKLSSDSMEGASTSAAVLLQGAQLLLEGGVLLTQGISLSLPRDSCPFRPSCFIDSILQMCAGKAVYWWEAPQVICPRGKLGEGWEGGGGGAGRVLGGER